MLISPVVTCIMVLQPMPAVTLTCRSDLTTPARAGLISGCVSISIGSSSGPQSHLCAPAHGMLDERKITHLWERPLPGD